jgi:peptidoglycan hydrolase-like amidase
MALLAKSYLLFYLNKKNIHPSIPESASYVAIDSPELFQKYVGAGAEKTLTKRYKALEATKNQVILYS